jgi:UDP-glucose 4-epimerase
LFRRGVRPGDASVETNQLEGYRGMRYLITGGAGFIGSHLVDALTTRGDHVLVLDDLSTGRLENLDESHHGANADAIAALQRDGDRGESEQPRPGAVEFIEGSVTDEALVNDCMSSVDACVHLASAVGVQLVVAQPLESVLRSTRGCDIVFAAAARRGCRLLFTSTSEVYGKLSGELSEDSDRVLGPPSQSRWSYATAKVFGEILAHGYHRQYGIETIVARLFNTVGPRQTGAYGMVLPRFVSQALAGEDLTVYGNGTQSRCFTHVLDTVHALVQLCDADAAAGRVYNVGGDRLVPVIELAGKVIERTGSDSKVRLIPYREAYEGGFEELGRRVPDTSALRELNGWKPSRTLDEMVDDVIAYEQSETRGAGRVPDPHRSESGAMRVVG